jgi:hypothetical protein
MGMTGGQPDPQVLALQSQVDELAGLVSFYEKKVCVCSCASAVEAQHGHCTPMCLQMSTLAEQHIIPAQAGVAGGV